MAKSKVAAAFIEMSKTARRAAKDIRRIPSAGGTTGADGGLDLAQTELNLVRAGLAV